MITKKVIKGEVPVADGPIISTLTTCSSEERSHAGLYLQPQPPSLITISTLFSLPASPSRLHHLNATYSPKPRSSFFIKGTV